MVGWGGRSGEVSSGIGFRGGSGRGGRADGWGRVGRPRSPAPGPRGGPGPERLVELDLADAYRLWRDLDALVLTAELQALLETEQARRDEPLQDLGGRGAHVGEPALLGDVHVHVVGAGALSHDHPFV